VGQLGPSEALIERFGDDISQATEQQLTIICRQIETLKSRPDLAFAPDIFNPVENLIAARQTQLTANTFQERLSVLADGLGGFVQVTDVKRGKAVLAEFKEWRSQALIVDESLAAALTEVSTRCESAYADALNKIQATLKVTVESRVGELARKLSFVHSFPEFDSAQATFQGGDYHELCELLLDTHFKEGMQGRIDTALAEKRASLESQSSNFRNERDERAKTQEENLRALCGNALESLSRVATPQSLEVWQKSNALYQEFNTSLVGAPQHLAVELRASFEQALTEKQRAFGAVGLGHFAEYVKDGQATFGKQKLAVFPGYSGLAIPTVVPSHIGSPLGKLRFTGIGGMAYQPAAEQLPIQIDHPRTKEAIAKYRPEALSAFAHRVRAVPLARPTWRITPWVEENLEKLAWAINLVQKRGQGLVILESEPGLGKNILLEMLACATNRELLTQPFYKQMTIDDLTFMATLNDNNTELVPAKFFNYVQTPGAIVFLDEFSAASDALQKKLNGLFTQDRTLSVSFGDDAKADRSTIFIAAINPLGTGGTNALNEDLKSRSIRVRLSFPQFKETVGTTTRFRSDEAEILYQYVDCLKELTIDEFRACWNRTVNNDRSAGVDQLLTAPRVKAIENLKIAIEVANKVRAAAKETARGATVAIPISFTWGMRQQEFIAAALNYSDDIKAVMQSVILSNVDNSTEEMAIEGMITACT
jgi:MoxR-like ATPase